MVLTCPLMKITKSSKPHKTMTKQTYIEPAVDARYINCESGIATSGVSQSGILQDWDENNIYQETL